MFAVQSASWRPSCACVGGRSLDLLAVSKEIKYLGVVCLPSGSTARQNSPSEQPCIAGRRLAAFFRWDGRQ